MSTSGALEKTAFRCNEVGVQPVYTRAAAEAASSADYFSSFCAGFALRVLSETPEELVFEMMGVEASIANALRRILLAEVPTVAIETVYFTRNTGIVQDEVLAHRLGLVPLNIDPREVEMMGPTDEPTDLNTFVFRLKAEGAAPAAVSGLAALEGEGDVASPYTNVYARQLEWVPKGEQEERLSRPAAVVDGEILLAKLAPGQVIHLEAHAVKGIGKDHAKFSPVATASYKLHTTIALGAVGGGGEFEGEEAERLVKVCPMGVFDIEDIAGKKGAPSRRRAYVKEPRKCTVCRECVRVAGWGERVRIERVANHFIFSVESTGALTSRELVVDALRILAEKAKALLREVGSGEGGAALPVLSPAATKGRMLSTMREGRGEAED